ncbi:ABC-type taurine transport system ATPase subunit [Luteibacter sp. HA06]
MDALFFDDMQALLAAFDANDDSEVEFRAHRIHERARARNQLIVSNAAASVVAAYRCTFDMRVRRIAVDCLASELGTPAR